MKGSHPRPVLSRVHSFPGGRHSSQAVPRSTGDGGQELVSVAGEGLELGAGSPRPREVGVLLEGREAQNEKMPLPKFKCRDPSSSPGGSKESRRRALGSLVIWFPGLAAAFPWGSL